MQSDFAIVERCEAGLESLEQVTTNADSVAAGGQSPTMYSQGIEPIPA